MFALFTSLYVWSPQRLGLAHVAHRDPWWLASTLLYAVLLPVVLIGVPVVILSAIYGRADPPRRAKLKVLFTIAVPVLFVALITAAVVWDLDWVWSPVKIAAVAAVASYSPGGRQSRTLWGLGIASLALAALFGDATAIAVEYRPQSVVTIILYAISALSGGFCFGCLVTCWRLQLADNPVANAEARER